FSPDGKRIVSGSADKTVKVWDAGSDQELLTLRGHMANVLSVAISPDGKRILSRDKSGNVLAWDSVSRQRLSDDASLKMPAGSTSVAVWGNLRVRADDHLLRIERI